MSAAPTVDGSTVTAVLDAGMPDAGYEIRWRVVSSDGHPITGVVPFTVGDGEPLADGAGGVEPGAAETGAEAGGASAPGTDARSSTQTRTAQEDEGPWRVVLVGASGAAVAVALLVLVQFLRRRSDAGGAQETGDEPASPETV